MKDPGAPCTTDTLLLSSFAEAEPGSLIVEMGCGSGEAILKASRRNPGCRWLGIDVRLPALRILMASLPGHRLHGRVDALCLSVKRVPLAIAPGIAETVMMNPPYGRDGATRSSSSVERNTARRGDSLLLSRFTRAGAHVLETGGRLVIVNRPDALAGIMLSCNAFDVPVVELFPVGPSKGPCSRIVALCRKGAGQGPVIHPQRSARQLMDMRQTSC